MQYKRSCFLSFPHQKITRNGIHSIRSQQRMQFLRTLYYICRDQMDIWRKVDQIFIKLPQLFVLLLTLQIWAKYIQRNPVKHPFDAPSGHILRYRSVANMKLVKLTWDPYKNVRNCSIKLPLLFVNIVWEQRNKHIPVNTWWPFI